MDTYNGHGRMHKDEAKSGKYLKKSCDGGYPYACNDIAKILYQYKYNDGICAIL